MLNACHQELSAICVGLIQMAGLIKKKKCLSVLKVMHDIAESAFSLCLLLFLYYFWALRAEVLYRFLCVCIFIFNLIGTKTIFQLFVCLIHQTLPVNCVFVWFCTVYNAIKIRCFFFFVSTTKCNYFLFCRLNTTFIATPPIKVTISSFESIMGIIFVIYHQLIRCHVKCTCTDLSLYLFVSMYLYFPRCISTYPHTHIHMWVCQIWVPI